MCRERAGERNPRRNKGRVGNPVGLHFQPGASLLSRSWFSRTLPRWSLGPLMPRGGQSQTARNWFPLELSQLGLGDQASELQSTCCWLSPARVDACLWAS